MFRASSADTGTAVRPPFTLLCRTFKKSETQIFSLVQQHPLAVQRICDTEAFPASRSENLRYNSNYIWTSIIINSDARNISMDT